MEAREERHSWGMHDLLIGLLSLLVLLARLETKRRSFNADLFSTRFFPPLRRSFFFPRFQSCFEVEISFSFFFLFSWALTLVCICLRRAWISSFSWCYFQGRRRTDGRSTLLFILFVFFLYFSRKLTFFFLSRHVHFFYFFPLLFLMWSCFLIWILLSSLLTFLFSLWVTWGSA